MPWSCYKVFCVMMSGRPLLEVARDTLFQTALTMVSDHARRRRFKVAGIEGLVTTKFQTGVMGSFAGVLFHAEADTIRGTAKLTYLVRDQDLEGIENAHWETLSEPFADTLSPAASCN